MFNKDRWQEIFETIKKNKLRTFLSGFTVALGIFIFIILFGFGNGLKNSFKEFFLDDATNILYIESGKTSKPFKGYKASRRIEFENEDLFDIQKFFSFYLEYITPRITRGAKIKFKNEYGNYTTRAVAPSHQFAEKTIVFSGRYLNDTDIKQKKKVAVIGRLVARDLFGEEDPIGKFVDIGKTVFKVVGVFKDSGGDNEERFVYIPYTTRQKMEKATKKIGSIIVAFKPEIGNSGALAFEKQLREYLKQKKFIAPSDSKGIFIRNVSDDLKRNQQFASALQIIVTFVGIGTLIAGIIGISNIMVFVVKERTKELGIRKALGASPKSVISMVLQESIFITTVSGYLGMFFAVLILKNIGDSLEDYFIKNPYINLSTAFFATIVLILFGAIAGYVPAKRAASIKPIVALRDE